jgi:elongation factor Ts
MASDMAMHVTATKPMALDETGISAEIIEQEKSIAAAQIKNKPANIVDKIMEGKMKKFFTENCLLEQQFVKDNTKTVAQVLAEAAEQAGGQAQIKRFVRFEVG